MVYHWLTCVVPAFSQTGQSGRQTVRYAVQIVGGFASHQNEAGSFQD